MANRWGNNGNSDKIYFLGLQNHCDGNCSESESCSVVSNSLQPHGLYSPWNSPGQNIGVGSLSLLQGIFPNQGSNLGLQHCRWIPYQLSHKGSPIKLKSSCTIKETVSKVKLHMVIAATKLKDAYSLKGKL